MTNLHSVKQRQARSEARRGQGAEVLERAEEANATARRILALLDETDACDEDGLVPEFSRAKRRGAVIYSPPCTGVTLTSMGKPTQST